MEFQTEINGIISRLPYYISNEFDEKFKGNFQVYIYGAGFMGCKYAELLTKNGFRVDGFFETCCDSSEEMMRYQLKILPIELAQQEDRVVVISSFKYFKEMKEQLLRAGFAETQIISPYGVFEKFYLPKFREALESFDDELSRRTVIDKLKCFVLNSVMQPVSAYFNYEIFTDGLEDEIFVDGGAFDGETSREFAYITNRRYKKIYCFEPTKASYNLAVKNLQEFDRIEIVNKGLYSSETVLEFKDFGTDQWNAANDFFMGHEWNGPAMAYDVIKIPVISLDRFFQDMPVTEYPTIVKLDIEGSEREALLGMRHILNTSHPKLIICAYHKIEDYFELTSTIKEICPGYTLKLRHYSDNVLESILFGKYA